MKTPLRIAIVGAGVLGAASAYALTKRFKDRVSVTVIERNSRPALETSGRNSGVLHSGIHEDLDSLKGRFARRGHELAKQFAKSHNIPMLSCGMLIVASSADALHILKQGPSFLNIYRNGKKQNIEMHLLTPMGIKSLEPDVRGLGGLYLPSVAVIESAVFVEKLLDEACMKEDCIFVPNQTIERIFREGTRYRIETQNAVIEADAVVNAAGLYADEIAKKAGFPYYTITPYRGEYYEVIGKERKCVNRLVYPVPVEHRVGKGIHLLKRPDGRLFVGPNARLVPSKNWYEEDKTPPEVFREVLARFCPALRDARLEWAYSGIRPKGSAFDLGKKSGNDFIFSVDWINPFFLNVIGYESPGLSGALAAGEYIADMALACHPALAS